MRANRPLIAAGYLVAAGLILAPLSETFISIWPLQLGAVSWRFGAAGLVSRGLLTSLLGLVLAGAVAYWADHHRIVLTLSVICGVSALILLAGALLMALDGVEFRASVNPEAKTAYDMAAVGGVTRILHGFLVTALMAWGGWIASRKTGSGRRGGGREKKVALNPPTA